MSQFLELSRFTVKPESVEEFLAKRPGVLDVIRRRYPGFVSAHLARLEGDTWVDVAFWENSEQCQVAMEEVPTIPEVAAWLALIGEDVSMEQAEVVQSFPAIASVTR